MTQSESMGMEIEQALNQISEIHHHLIRTECYRGYRSVTMASSGVVALLGGVFQSGMALSESGFVWLWVGLAALNLVIVSSEIAVEYWMRLTRLEQRLTCRTVGQFLPSLVAGALLTLAFWGCGDPVANVVFLPGMWSLIFSLGVFASRPYLPQGVGWVGLFYLAAGSVLLSLAHDGHNIIPWAMPVTFGLGQMLLALVLYWNLERTVSP